MNLKVFQGNLYKAIIIINGVHINLFRFKEQAIVPFNKLGDLSRVELLLCAYKGSSVGIEELVAKNDNLARAISFDRKILSEAINLFEERPEYFKDKTVSVNLSALSFTLSLFHLYLLDFVIKLNDGCRQLVIEVTERSDFLTKVGAEKTIKLLKECGVEIALDDYGVNTLSKKYVAEYDFDYIKIDCNKIKLESDHLKWLQQRAVKGVVLERPLISIRASVFTNDCLVFCQGYRYHRPVTIPFGSSFALPC